MNSVPAATPAEVDVQEARRLQAQGALVVDVREMDEWSAGHVPGATHIPLGQMAFRQAELPRDAEILLFCRSGNRSGLAAQQLRRVGFSRAINVRGGLIAWQRSGLPLER
jgi:rhodanese-related sulfurtransferase